MVGNYFSIVLCLCFTISSFHFSDAWFLRRANMRRYGGRPKIIVGDHITMPANDNIMMQYVKGTAEQKIKEYNAKQRLKANQDSGLYDLHSGSDVEESSSDHSFTIGFPFPLIRSKSKSKPIKTAERVPIIDDSDYAYSTINNKYKEFQYPESDGEYIKGLAQITPTIQTTSASSPDYMKMVKIDFTRGNTRDSDSVLKFYKMEDSSEPQAVVKSKKKGPMAFVIQWNLPMVFQKV